MNILPLDSMEDFESKYPNIHLNIIFKCIEADVLGFTNDSYFQYLKGESLNISETDIRNLEVL